MARSIKCFAILSAFAPLLAACGGGGVNSSPPPVSAPTPTTAPLPTAPLAPDAIALKSDVVLKGTEISMLYVDGGVGAYQPIGATPKKGNVTISYDSASGEYVMSLGGQTNATFEIKSYEGTNGQAAKATLGTLGPAGTSTEVWLPVPDGDLSEFSYSHFGHWTAPDPNTQYGSNVGWFAYGVPATNLPSSGTASYSAEIHGTAIEKSDFWLKGDVKLTFNFATNGLTGFMHPYSPDSNGGVAADFGTYNFKLTSFSAATGVYSGQFVLPAGVSGPSGFQGMLTGPGGAETVASFFAPYLCCTNYTGFMNGVWIGKKD